MKIGNVGCELLGNAAVFTMSLQGAAGELILVDVKVSDARLEGDKELTSIRETTISSDTGRGKGMTAAILIRLAFLVGGFVHGKA